jgi:AsmA protein
MAKSKSRKIILLSLGGFVALLVLVAVTMMYFVDANVYKPRLQAAASEALGMEVSVGGRLGIGFFPGMLLTMNDVHIRNQGKELVVAEKVRLGLDLLPLLHDEFRITQISLIHPKITIELGADGKYNFEKPQAAGATLPAANLAKISLSGATLGYTDKQSGGGFDAGDCSLDLRHLLLAGGGTDIMKDLSYTAELNCGEVRTKDYSVTDLKLTANAKNGVFDFKSITMKIFGGQGSGSVQADYSGAAPLYHVGFSLLQFRIEELLKTRSPNKIAEGAMDFSMKLSLQGKAVKEMEESASGEAGLRGENLTLNGHDLDLEFTRFETSQNFNLVDVGAYFFAGPVGLAVTKGYNFANVLKGSGGVSAIPAFVSHWKVERGVMYAQDVAMATNRHRMALLGGLDITNARFVDVTLALLDNKGCAVVRQKISGPFDKPLVEQPSILKSLAGPAIKLLKKGRNLLPGGECEVIYTGSVASPG